MRPPSPHQRRAQNTSLKFTFEGSECGAAPGDTVAAALTAQRQLGLRVAHEGDPRGVFCGMGVCHECLVTVDGVRTARSCMLPVAEGMAVERGPHLAQLRAGSASPQPSSETRDGEEVTAVDVVVVGAGAAGLTAAIVCAESGASVLVIDERSQPGGQYYKQVNPRLGVPLEDLDAQQAAGARLVARARQAGVRLLSGTEVWGAFDGPELRTLGPEGCQRFVAEQVVLAVGAFERGVAVPGWTLPGFSTTGAAQTLLRAYGVTPGDKVLVSGNGPLNLQVAAELAAAGVRVVAVADAGRPTAVANLPAQLVLGLTAPVLVAKGLGYLHSLRKEKVPLVWGSAVVRADGERTVTRATIARLGPDGRPSSRTGRTFDVDAVCVGFGFQPSLELPRAFGCATRWDPSRGQLCVVTDARGATSVPGVWVIGDGRAVSGAHSAEADGQITAVAVLAELGISPRPATLLSRLRRRRLRLAQWALRRIYRAPTLHLQLADADTLVCRCESVRLAEVDAAAMDQGSRRLGNIKRATRLGMGRCQGRYCAVPTAQYLSGALGTELDEDDLFAPRPPVKPVRIGLIAREEMDRPTSAVAGADDLPD